MLRLLPRPADVANAALLREFAAREDRADVEALGWSIVASDAGWRLTGWGADAKGSASPHALQGVLRVVAG